MPKIELPLGWPQDRKPTVEKAISSADVYGIDNPLLGAYQRTPRRGYFVVDYFVKGGLKEAARLLKQFGAIKQLRSKVVNYLFITPRKIYIAEPTANLQIVERPLRAQTPQGERVSIARSYAVPEGTEISFTVEVLQDTLPRQCLHALLDYGRYTGFGQWRGGGYGRFEVVKFEEQ